MYYGDELERIKATDGIPLDRLEVIANAEREGRCVVLPCGAGKTVYVVVGKKYAAYNVVGIESGPDGWDARLESLEGNGVKRLAWANFLDFGKTVFLTRADAEAALKEGEK